MSLNSYSFLSIPLNDIGSYSNMSSQTSGCTGISSKRSHRHQGASRSGYILPDSTTSVGSRTHRKSRKWSHGSSPRIPSLMGTPVKLQHLRCTGLKDTPHVLHLWGKVNGPLPCNQMKSIAFANSICHSITSGLSYIVEDVGSKNGKPFISGCMLANRLTYRDFEVSTMMSPNYWFNAQVFTSEWQTMMCLFNQHMLFLCRLMYQYQEALFITLPLIEPSIVEDLYKACLLYTKMFIEVLSNAQKKNGLKLALFIANNNLQKTVARNVGFVPLCDLPLPIGSYVAGEESNQVMLTLMVLYPNVLSSQP